MREAWMDANAHRAQGAHEADDWQARGRDAFELAEDPDVILDNNGNVVTGAAFDPLEYLRLSGMITENEYWRRRLLAEGAITEDEYWKRRAYDDSKETG